MLSFLDAALRQPFVDVALDEQHEHDSAAL
jgi:hypothetical protein